MGLQGLVLWKVYTGFEGLQGKEGVNKSLRIIVVRVQRLQGCRTNPKP